MSKTTTFLLDTPEKTVRLNVATRILSDHEES